MRYFVILVTLIAIGCNSGQDTKKAKTQESRHYACFAYPPIVDSLQVRDLYDSTRWFLYTWHCDEKYLPASKPQDSITFGELPLRFNSVVIENDTVRINFQFTDWEEPILTSMTRDYKELVTGVAFDKKSRQKVYMLFSGGTVKAKGANSRYENPLQPEVRNYIKSNWEKLDSCFRALAEKTEGLKSN